MVVAVLFVSEMEFHISQTGFYSYVVDDDLELLIFLPPPPGLLSSNSRQPVLPFVTFYNLQAHTLTPHRHTHHTRTPHTHTHTHLLCDV